MLRPRAEMMIAAHSAVAGGDVALVQAGERMGFPRICWVEGMVRCEAVVGIASLSLN